MSTPRAILFFLLLLFALLAAYFPVLNGPELIDDADLITKNPHLRSVSGLAQTWLKPTSNQDYYPLTLTSWWLEYQLLGPDFSIAGRDLPFLSYHLNNIFLHAAGAATLCLVLLRLGMSSRLSIFSALIFALHPINVESVAWMAQRKNTLSVLFYLLSALFYLRALHGRAHPPADLAESPAPSPFSITRYILSLFFFICALLSKPLTMTLAASLPLLSIILNPHPLARRPSFRSLLVLLAPSIPFFALSIPMALLTMWIQKNHVGTTGPEFDLSLLHRFLLAPNVALFYALKTLFPYGLLYFYPRWSLNLADWHLYIAPLILSLVLGTLALLAHRRPPASLPALRALAATLGFLITLAPALGFVPIYWHIFSFVHNHVAYHATLWLIPLLLSAFAALLIRIIPLPAARTVLALALSVLVFACALVTHARAKLFADPDALYTHALQHNPRSFWAHVALSILSAHRNDFQSTARHARLALEIKPDYPPALVNLAGAQVRLGDFQSALANAQRAIALRPAFHDAWLNLGHASLALNLNSQAVDAFSRAAELRPDDPLPRAKLGLALGRLHRFREAADHCRAALDLDPSDPEAWCNLGVALANLHQLPAARDAWRRASDLDPSASNPDGSPSSGASARAFLDRAQRPSP